MKTTELKTQFEKELQAIGEKISGKEIKIIAVNTDLANSTIYAYLNGNISNLEVAEKIINACKKL